jgi:RNA polymerase sigma factor (sigma-70 family)
MKTDMDEDHELLRRYVEDGSEAAFTELVHRHFDLVYSAACRQVGGDDQRAREVAQTVFADLARKARALRRHPALRGWLYTSTHFAARKLRRSEWRRRQREMTAQAMQDLSPTSETPSDWRQLGPRLDEAMQALGPRDREAILLRFFSGRRFAEIGDRLGLSEKAAQMRVDRALDKLRAALVRRGITSTAAALAVALADQAVVAAPAGWSAAVAASVLANSGTAASGGAITAGLLHFMATSKLTIVLVGSCAILALGSGLYYALQARAATAALMHMPSPAHAQDRLQAVIQQVAGERSRAAILREPGDHSAAAKPMAPTVTGPTGTIINEEIAENPQLRQLLAANFRAQFDLTHGLLFRELNFTPEQVGQFETLKLKLMSDLYDLQQAARLRGAADSGADPALQAAEQQVRDRYNDALRGLVGEPARARVEDYERTLPALALANQVAAGVYYSATPLTKEQADRMVAIIAAQSSAYRDGGPVDPAALNWEGVLVQAQGVLTPPQLAALQSVRAQREIDQLDTQGAVAALTAPETP